MLIYILQLLFVLYMILSFDFLGAGASSNNRGVITLDDYVLNDDRYDYDDLNENLNLHPTAHRASPTLPASNDNISTPMQQSVAAKGPQTCKYLLSIFLNYVIILILRILVDNLSDLLDKLRCTICTNVALVPQQCPHTNKHIMGGANCVGQWFREQCKSRRCKIY